eukprot:SAG31_NODE_38436_length_296_cov_0.781726_1_plen_53_part_10
MQALAEGHDIALEALTFEQGRTKCNAHPDCCGLTFGALPQRWSTAAAQAGAER